MNLSLRTNHFGWFSIMFFFFVGCGHKEADVAKIEDLPPVVVSAVLVNSQVTQAPVVYSATIEPVDQAQIATKVMGQIKAIHVEEGEAVQRGQLLVELDSNDIQAKLAQAEAGIAEATAHFENAERNLARFEELFAKNAATQKEVDDVRVMFQSAKARLEGAKQMKKEVEELLQYTQLLAPFSGVVTKKHAAEGDLAKPGFPIITLENNRQVKITALIPENRIHLVREGMPVRVVIPSVGEGNATYDATIDQIFPSADPQSHQFEIKVVMENPSGDLKAGMFARVLIEKSRQETIRIPREAIFQRGQLEGVYVVSEDNRARLRWIRTGRSFGSDVEVIAGLDAGERVIVNYEGNLKDGQRVEVRS